MFLLQFLMIIIALWFGSSLIDVWKRQIDQVNENLTETISLEQLGQSRGSCTNDFHAFIEQRDAFECAPDDRYIHHLLRNKADKPKNEAVKCVRYYPQFEQGPSRLLVVEDYDEILRLIKPISKTVAMEKPGNCVLLIFYTNPSLQPEFAAIANALHLYYPTIRIAAVNIDEVPLAVRRFGIVGLPTIVLTRDGRIVDKFKRPMEYFMEFMKTKTNLKPAKVSEIIQSVAQHGPLSLIPPPEEFDFLLVLAWGFIILCCIYHGWRANCVKRFVRQLCGLPVEGDPILANADDGI